MPLDVELLTILVCPETRQPVAVGDEKQLAELNRRIAAGKVTNRAGARVGEPLQMALVRADGGVAYPVRNDIPVMLAEEAIPL